MWSDLDQSLGLLGVLIAGVVLLTVLLSRLEDDLNDRADSARSADQSRRRATFRPGWRRSLHVRSNEGRDRR